MIYWLMLIEKILYIRNCYSIFNSHLLLLITFFNLSYFYLYQCTNFVCTIKCVEVPLCIYVRNVVGMPTDALNYWGTV